MKNELNLLLTLDLVKFSCEEGGCSYTTHTLYFLKTHVEKVHKGIRLTDFHIYFQMFFFSLSKKVV